MADLTARIVPKASSVAGEFPTGGDLIDGEIALNTADGILYYRHVDNTIGSISTGVVNLDDLADVNVPSPLPGNYLKWSGTEWTAETANVEDIDNVVIVGERLGGQVLLWSSQQQVWTNGYPYLGESDLSELKDINVSGLSEGQGLRYDGSTWVNAPYFDNPLLTQGDIIIFFGGQPTRLGIGTSGQSLIVQGGVPSWGSPEVNGSLDNLSDVDTTTSPPTDGQVLTWSGLDEEWQPSTPEAVIPTLAINDLTDVQTVGVGHVPTDGQALVWDATMSHWMPGSVAGEVSPASIDSLTDVDTTTIAPVADQVLAWNGSNWVPAAQSGGVSSIIAGSGISIDQPTGNVTITNTGGGSGGGIEEAPQDGTPYVRQDADWISAPSGGGGGSGVSSIIAGSGISIDQATGDVTITSTGGIGAQGAYVKTTPKAVWTALWNYDRSQNYSSQPSGRITATDTTNLEVSITDSDGVDRSADLGAWLATLSAGTSLTISCLEGIEVSFEFQQFTDQSTSASHLSYKLTAAEEYDTSFFTQGTNTGNWIVIFSGYYIKEFEEYLSVRNVDSHGNTVAYDADLGSFVSQEFSINQMQDFREDFLQNPLRAYMPVLEYTKVDSSTTGSGVIRKQSGNDNVLCNADLNGYQPNTPSNFPVGAWNLGRGDLSWMVSFDNGSSWKAYRTGKFFGYSSSYGSAGMLNAMELGVDIDALEDGTKVLMKGPYGLGSPERMDGQPVVWSETNSTYSLGQPAISAPYKMPGGNSILLATTSTSVSPTFFYADQYSGGLRFYINDSEHVARELQRIQNEGLDVASYSIEITPVTARGERLGGTLLYSITSASFVSNNCRMNLFGSRYAIRRNGDQELYVEVSLKPSATKGRYTAPDGTYKNAAEVLSQNNEPRAFQNGQIPTYDWALGGFVPQHMTLSTLKNIKWYDWSGTRLDPDDDLQNALVAGVGEWYNSATLLYINRVGLGGTMLVSDLPSGTFDYWISLDEGSYWLQQSASDIGDTNGYRTLAINSTAATYLNAASIGQQLWVSFSDPTSPHILSAKYDSNAEGAQPTYRTELLNTSLLDDISSELGFFDSQILVYDSATSKWIPKDSEFSNVVNVTSYKYFCNSLNSTYPSSSTNGPGFFGKRNGYVYFNNIDASGIDHSAEFATYDGNPPSIVYFSVDNGNTWDFGVPTFADDSVMDLRFDGYPSSVGFLSAGMTLLVAFENNPAAIDSFILKWDAASSGWTVDQGSYVETSVLKAEVAASTDFADFQARIAAL